MPLPIIRQTITTVANSFQSDLSALYPSQPSSWVRARVCHNPEDPGFGRDEMGPPPAGKNSGGRVNPADIPYFYIASDKKTAIAEVRPDVGAKVSIATFDHLQGKVCDLRSPKDSFSPLLLSDADTIQVLADAVAFLEMFRNQLSEPVLPHRATLDYLPLQYICEFLKALRFVGIVFSSSVATGVNAVLFSVPHTIVADQVCNCRIDKVAFTDVCIEGEPSSGK